MTAAPAKAEPFRDLVDESLDESAFLWKRWEADLQSLTRNLAEVVSWTEDRLQGALDGVRAGGSVVTEVLEPVLAGGDPAALPVAAHLLAAKSAPSARTLLAATLRDASGPRLWSLLRGVETADLDRSFAPVTAVLSSPGPEHSAALCRLKSFRRSAPGRELNEAFESKVVAHQVEALRAARYAPDELLGRCLSAGLKSAEPAVRRAAIETGLYRRLPHVWELVLQLTRERSPAAAPFLPLVASLGSPEEQQSVVGALREPRLQQPGLFALGFIGTPEAVETCLVGMRDPKLARMAGEAYSAITGANLVRDSLAAPEPEDAPSLPPIEEDALDADLVPTAPELWPLPDLDAVRAHWARIRSGYASGVRHLGGRPISLGVLVDTVEAGPMLRRPGLILEAAIRTGGQYDVEPRAFAHVQRRMMAAARGAVLQSGPR